MRDDSVLLKGLWELLDSSDIIVAQNGARFDIRKINARLIMAGFKPYSPIRVVDTLQVAKRVFGFTSNKLAWASKYLTDTPKSEHRKYPGFELWLGCLRDDPKYWAEMKKYNIRDVVATEKYYLQLRPWITNHPNVSTYSDSVKKACTKCNSTDLQKRGTTVTQGGRYQRYRCQKCGGWGRDKTNILPAPLRKDKLV